jgi:large subunit ribosomal protein L9
MPKTEVILTHNVIGLGAESDQVKVAAGYARNYLFPLGFAIPLTSANKRQIEALKKRRGDRESKELHSMSDLAATLSKLTLVLHVKTGEDGKMFGSVTSGTIVEELRHQYDAQLDKRKINLPHPLKTLGEHEVPLHLHHDVDCVLKVRIESSTPLSPEVQAAVTAQRAAAKAAEAKEAKESKPVKTEKRGARAEKSEGKEGKGSKKAEKAEKIEKVEKPQKAEKKSKKA